MDDQKYYCNQCGKCCYQEIPITLLDIHRIANHLGVEDRRVFLSKIQRSVSEKSQLFKISKKPSGACIFLDEEDRCSIHTFKPNGCNLYFCRTQISDPVSSDPVSMQERKASLWEQSVASTITKHYIKRNGAEWNGEDYHKAISNILDNVVTDEKEKIKLATKQGHPVCQIYNCSECSSRGTCAKETIVTIDDIRRILDYLNITGNEFFRKYLDDCLSCSGVLQLLRDEHCVFFDSRQCHIQSVRPMHCRFTPCPARINDSCDFDCLYLGSGTVKEQYRHQASMQMTREYVEHYGLRYHKKGMEKQLNKLDQILKDSSYYRDFCEKIVSFRYMNDALRS